LKKAVPKEIKEVKGQFDGFGLLVVSIILATMSYGLTYLESNGTAIMFGTLAILCFLMSILTFVKNDKSTGKH
jgi:hypothetical protein